MVDATGGIVRVPRSESSRMACPATAASGAARSAARSTATVEERAGRRTRRSRSELVTTETLDSAIAAPA